MTASDKTETPEEEGSPTEAKSVARRGERVRFTENSILETRGDPDPGSRTSAKKKRVNNELALSELAEQLLNFNEARLTKLDVSEPAIDALLDAAKIKTHAARARQMRLVRARLRESDWMGLRVRLDQMRAGFVPEVKESDAADQWVEQLLVQGDQALNELVDRHPSLDRNRLRALVRNVKNSSEGKRAKTRKVLADAVRSAVDALEEGPE